MTRVLVTTCSAAKRRDPGLLPARHRYRSPRLAAVAARAAATGIPWLILSGEFGLLAPDDPIPWYDHLLRPEEAADLVPRVADRLRELDVSAVTLVTGRLADDPNLAPYVAVMREACAAAGASWRHEEDPALDD